MAESPHRETFELVQLLGRGSFAQTYLARVLDDELAEHFGTSEVALKIPFEDNRRGVQHDLEMNAALHLLIKKSQSVNLVRYLGFGVHKGQVVMVMEYIKEGSLRKKLGKPNGQVRIPMEESLEIGEGILEGLTAIHQKGVFHRDIKPENILMDGRTPKIADLGLSRMLDTGEQAMTKLGTPFYCSPEILKGTGASFSSDIWSVGVTLYEMVTGRLPFGDWATAPRTLLDLICDSDPKPASELSEAIPKKLSDIVTRALEKDPVRRYASADDMAAEIKRLRLGPEELVEKEIAALLGADLPSADLEQRYIQLTRKYPKSARAHQVLGEFYNTCQRYWEAIATFQRAIGHHPENAGLYWDIALAHQGLGQRADAVRMLQKAIDLGLEPDLAMCARTLLAVLKGPSI